jgi:ABC-2 type transport system permease protein
MSGLLLPLSLGPDWLRVLAHRNPKYYAVEAARDLAAGTTASIVVSEGFLVMCAAVVAAPWWGTGSYRKAMT